MKKKRTCLFSERKTHIWRMILKIFIHNLVSCLLWRHRITTFLTGLLAKIFKTTKITCFTINCVIYLYEKRKIQLTPILHPQHRVELQRDMERSIVRLVHRSSGWIGPQLHRHSIFWKTPTSLQERSMASPEIHHFCFLCSESVWNSKSKQILINQ